VTNKSRYIFHPVFNRKLANCYLIHIKPIKQWHIYIKKKKGEKKGLEIHSTTTPPSPKRKVVEGGFTPTERAMGVVPPLLYL